MTAGLQIINSSGQIQIDENLIVPRFVASGSVARDPQQGSGPLVINLGNYGINIQEEIPIILVRPAEYNRFVGGAYITRAYGTAPPGNYCLIDNSDCGFDYSVFSTKVAGVRDNGNFGFQTFNSSGVLIYDSNNRHTRVINNFKKAASTDYLYPYSFTLSGFNSMPWIMVNNLPVSYSGATDSAGGVYIRVNSNTSITVDHRVAGAAFTSFREIYDVPTSKTNDPYNNRPANYLLADYG